MKTALVTGASSGIGKAIGQALLLEGMTVIGLCRSVEELPEGIAPLPCDLRETEQIKAAFSTLDHLGILVNSAGLAYLSRLSDGDPELYRQLQVISRHPGVPVLTGRPVGLDTT